LANQAVVRLRVILGLLSAMIKFGAQAGAIDEDRVVRETLGSIKRAGADLIFTYFAMDLALAGI
jgi:porphobilinogen synthase